MSGEREKHKCIITLNMVKNIINSVTTIEQNALLYCCRWQICHSAPHHATPPWQRIKPQLNIFHKLAPLPLMPAHQSPRVQLLRLNVLACNCHIKFKILFPSNLNFVLLENVAAARAPFGPIMDSSASVCGLMLLFRLAWS